MSEVAGTVVTEDHHRYSASGAEGWANCPGKISLEQGKSEKYSPYADEGSAAHYLASECLIKQAEAIDFLGQLIICYSKDGRAGQCFFDVGMPEGATESSRWEVTRDMCRYVQIYVDQVNHDAKDGTLLVEQRVEFGTYIGDPGAFGTADAIIIMNDGKTVKIRDLKYGYKPVSPEENMQMMLYALGALHEYEYLIDLDELENIDLRIIQPRVGAIESISWVTTLQRLFEFAEQAKQAIAISEEALSVPADKRDAEWQAKYLRPSEKGCTWCKAKATCPALAAECLTDMTANPATLDGLVDLDTPDLDAIMDAALHRITEVDFQTLVKLYAVTKKIKMWAEGIEDRMFHDMMLGHKTPHYKLVKGRQGNRKWVSEAEVEEAMRKMRLKVDEMYDRKVISVATAEKKMIGAQPKNWKKLQQYITRDEGKLTVAPMGDKRESFDPFGEKVALLPDLSNLTLDDLL